MLSCMCLLPVYLLLFSVGMGMDRLILYEYQIVIKTIQLFCSFLHVYKWMQ
jgi:hypothetical protein